MSIAHLTARLDDLGEFSASRMVADAALSLFIEPPMLALLEALVAAIERRHVLVVDAEALLAGAAIPPKTTRSGALVTGVIDEGAALDLLARCRAVPGVRAAGCGCTCEDPIERAGPERGSIRAGWGETACACACHRGRR